MHAQGTKPVLLHKIPLKTCLVREPNLVMDGHRSFPSGHSSAAFSSGVFIALFLASKLSAWNFSVSRPVADWALDIGGRSRLARLVVSLVPILGSTWVAVTRVQDHVSMLLGFCS